MATSPMTTNGKRQPTNPTAAASGVPASTRPVWPRANCQLISVLQDAPREPAGDHHDAGRVAARAPEPHQEAGGRQLHPRIRHAVQHGAGGHRHRQDGHGQAHAEAVEGDADRNLRQEHGHEEAPLAKPSASEDSARSRISSGPMTDVEERKNWDRAVVDASIASTATVAVHVGAAGARAPPAPLQAGCSPAPSPQGCAKCANAAVPMLD